jgi:hypothetical protein
MDGARLVGYLGNFQQLAEKEFPSLRFRVSTAQKLSRRRRSWWMRVWLIKQQTCVIKSNIDFHATRTASHQYLYQRCFNMEGDPVLALHQLSHELVGNSIIYSADT